MSASKIDLNLFGACIARSSDGHSYSISGAKHRALLILLATAPFGMRSRSFLQETLWGRACYDSGRQSLRRALSDLRRIMGNDFDRIIKTRNADVALDLTKVNFLGSTSAGRFLEGLGVRETLFQNWLQDIRQNPRQLDGLFSGCNVQRPVSTVAILPFQLICGPGGMRPLGDWMASEISRALSRSNLLSVISHFSSRQLARGVIELEKVQLNLKADYVATGTMRLLADEIVIDVDFVDLRSGCIIWTRQFKGLQAECFDLSASCVAEISQTIGRSIAEASLAYVQDRPLEEVRDHNLLLGAVELMHRPTLHNFTQARKVLDEMLRRMPKAAEVHAWKSKWHVLSVFNKWSGDPAKDTQKAIDCTARALDLNPDHAFALTIDGFAHNNLLKQLDTAKARYESALESDPNMSFCWLLKGALHAFRDEAEDALKASDKAVHLSPIDPFGYFYDSLCASTNLSAGRYEEALALADRSLARNDRHISTVRAKITALHNLGRAEEARQAAGHLIRLEPSCTVSSYLSNHPAGEFELGKRVAMAMQAAGVPKG